MADAEIIVTGGGSAGCAMAGRLAAAGVKVLLLEAGKSGEHIRLKVPALTSGVVQDPDFDWKYQAEPDPTIGGRADVWAGGKRLGGGSSINGMLYVRGHQCDYDRWAELGARGWAFKDVAPYFRRTETNSAGGGDYRGDSGPVGVDAGRLDYPIIGDWLQAAEALGVERNPDHNGARPGEGTDFAQNTQKNGMRSPATGYLKLPGARENLRVELEARVLRILVEDGRAVGVEYLQGGQTRRAMAQRGVVVSSGCLNTPRLLMLSGIGPAAHQEVRHLADQVQAAGVAVEGAHVDLVHEVRAHVLLQVPAHPRRVDQHRDAERLQLRRRADPRQHQKPRRVQAPGRDDHATLGRGPPGLPALKVFDAHGLNLIGQVANFLVRRRGILTVSIGQAHAFVKSRPELPAPNLHLTFACFAFDLDAQGRLVLRKGNAVSTMVGLARPRSRGTVTLRSADPMAPPVIRHQLLGVEDDAVQIAEGIEIARRIMAQPGVKPFVTSEARPGAGVTGQALVDYVHMAAIPMYHPVGACRMGSDGDAVVDPELKVRGVDGLWVCDNSIMPSLPVGNTNATALMIGDKGSDHVLRALRNTPMLTAA